MDHHRNMHPNGTTQHFSTKKTVSCVYIWWVVVCVCLYRVDAIDYYDNKAHRKRKRATEETKNEWEKCEPAENRTDKPEVQLILNEQRQKAKDNKLIVAAVVCSTLFVLLISTYKYKSVSQRNCVTFQFTVCSTARLNKIVRCQTGIWCTAGYSLNSIVCYT